MAEYKVACPQCGQHVSGDESFLGITVQCPICSTQFQFPTDLAPADPSASMPPNPPLNAPANGDAVDLGQYFNVPAPTGPAPSSAVQKSSSLAMWSMILGILGILSVFCFSPLAGFFAIIFGIIALVRISASDGALVGNGKAVIGMVLGVISLGVSVFEVNGVRSGEPAIETAFDQADKNVSFIRGLDIGYGNTEEAQKFATALSANLKEIRDVAIDGEGGKQFRTFCQLNEDSAAFLIRVPELRNYTEDAKDFIAEAAWSVAQDVLIESNLPDGSKLGIGTRGALIYDKVLIGEHLKSYHDDDSEESGIKINGALEEDLEWFFPKLDPVETEVTETSE